MMHGTYNIMYESVKPKDGEYNNGFKIKGNAAISICRQFPFYQALIDNRSLFFMWHNPFAQ
jgi:hypothetical protein